MSFAAEDLSLDGFLGGRLRIHQPRKGYRAATDPVFLAAFTPARPGERVLDLGCGAGTAGLCLARRVAGIELHGLELQPDYAELALRNAAENGIAMTVHQGDLRRPPAALRALSFDHVILNPPFYRGAAATGARDAGRDTAHREGAARLADWIAAGLKRVAPKGRIVVVHRTERLAELLAALAAGAGAIEILPLASRPGRPAARVLIRAQKASAAPLTLHLPFLIHDGRAHSDSEYDYSDKATRILRAVSDLSPYSP